MRAISALAILALTALPAAGASAVSSASARIVSPTTANIEFPVSVGVTSNGVLRRGLRISMNAPAAFSFAVRLDGSEISVIDSPRSEITSADGGGLVSTQDLEISLRATAIAGHDAIRPASAAHLLVTCHAN